MAAPNPGAMRRGPSAALTLINTDELNRIMYRDGSKLELEMIVYYK
jgi:hypothetical protein